MIARTIWDRLQVVNNNVFRVLGIAQSKLEWSQNVVERIVKDNILESTIAHSISARAFTWFAQKTGQTLKAKDKSAFLLRNGFPAHSQRSGVWDKARTIVGQISQMDKGKTVNPDVEQLSNRFCALVDPVMVELYGANAELDSTLLDPIAAKDVAANLHNRVRQLWVEHANRVQQPRLEIEAGAGPPAEGSQAAGPVSSTQVPANFGVTSLYNTTFKKSATGHPTKPAKVNDPTC